MSIYARGLKAFVGFVRGAKALSLSLLKNALNMKTNAQGWCLKAVVLGCADFVRLQNFYHTQMHVHMKPVAKAMYLRLLSVIR
mmetsp:Transcript_2825/g.4432  ORF Transcript_2825/g.4432 Transcript_2825/m.4432 type:complete len:83 (-) Transcript_2825:259-507(-)